MITIHIHPQDLAFIKEAVHSYCHDLQSRLNTLIGSVEASKLMDALDATEPVAVHHTVKKSKAAPYGWRKDGKPRGKPGRPRKVA